MDKTSQTPVITIRIASIDNVYLLMDLGKRTFYDTFAHLNSKEDMDLYMNRSFNEAQVSLELADKRNIFLIAYSNEQPAGYAKIRKSETPDGLEGTRNIEIERIYAGKEFIGKRIGQHLMEACLEYATGHGYDVVWLGVWEHNARAIAFYQKYGFEKFGDHPFILGTDHQTDILLKKNLQMTKPHLS